MEVHDHELHRMDDDGAPAHSEPRLRIATGTLEPTIGIKTESPSKERVRESGLVVIGDGDGPIDEETPANALAPQPLNWDTYLAWRKTKCRPYDYLNGPAVATDPSRDFKPESLREMVAHPGRIRALEEIDQATLEVIGEVAELGELFKNNGPRMFTDDDVRAKLIDEAGDIFFCGCWTLDAWGENPLYGQEDLEFIRVTDGDPLAILAIALAMSPTEKSGRVHILIDVARAAASQTYQCILAAQTAAGLLANSAKKLIYQRRQQNVQTQVGRVAETFYHVNQLLVLANSSVEEALMANMKKLDARFPNGYQPGQGGGNRTGAGA